MFAARRFGVAAVVALGLLVVLATTLRGQSAVRPPEPTPVGKMIEITYVQPGTPAYRAGLEVGDRIIEVNGEGVESLSALQRALVSAGYSARLTLLTARNSDVVHVYVYPIGGRIGIDGRVVLHFRAPY
jgi:S1-C subfamily serine protease